jgi:uncharacterized protein DUF3276
MEGTEGTEDKQPYDNRRDEVFSKAVRAGKRTYFFDVKATRAEDYYLTITESKRKFNNETQKFYFEKHKLFLYKEDFEKFTDGLEESIAKIKELKAEQGEEVVEKVATEFSDISFDDLGTDKPKEEETPAE